MTTHESKWFVTALCHNPKGMLALVSSRAAIGGLIDARRPMLTKPSIQRENNRLEGLPFIEKSSYAKCTF